LRDIAAKNFIDHFAYLDQDSGQGPKVPLAIGSGLVSVATVNDTSVIVAVSDRGPNVALEDTPAGGVEQVVFPRPNFNPVLVPLAIRGTAISSPSEFERTHSPLGTEFRGPVPMSDSSGALLTGLPPNSRHERAIDSSLLDIQRPKESPLGIDPEAITYDPTRQNLWIAEEYFPSILAVSPSNGRVLERRLPGDGLPKLLRNRVPNRGFEAIAYTPADNLVAILQTPLRDSVSKEQESFVRMLIIPANPTSTAPTSTLAIPLPAGAHPASYKIGEVVALSDSTFLAFEAYEASDGQKHYHLILLDISGAQEIDSERFIARASEIAAPVHSRTVLDFKDLDWASGKIEGLAIINPKTLLISKDNDFGVKLSKKGKERQFAPKVSFKEVPTEFLIIELRKPLQEYLPTLSKPVAKVKN
jgi:hypothetical protein